MANKRYYVDPDFINPHFSREEIIFWNSYLRANYNVWIYFERMALNYIATGRKYLSSRDIICWLRMKYKWNIVNAVSPFLAFMFCMKYPQHQDKFKRTKRKHLSWAK